MITFCGDADSGHIDAGMSRRTQGPVHISATTAQTSYVCPGQQAVTFGGRADRERVGLGLMKG